MMKRRAANDMSAGLKGMMTAGRVSSRVLVVLITLSAVVFGAFYLIGYDMPWLSDPRFTAPLLTDVVLLFIYVLMAVILLLTAVSVVRGMRLRSGGMTANGVPAGRIAWGTAALLVVSLLLTFAFGSAEPLTVNGRKFTSAAWLRLTDMFINTSIILAVVAIAVIAFGVTGLNRRLTNRIRR